MENKKIEQQTRREFIIGMGVVSALGLAVLGFFRNILLFFSPAKKKETMHKYLVAKVDEIPIGQAKEMSIQGKPVFVVHLEDGFKVMSGVCTHLGCMVKWEANKDRFYCPCHQGVFDRNGEVVAGPPPRALDKFEVEIDKNLVFIQVDKKMKGPWA